MKVLLISIYKPNVGGIVTHVDNLMKYSKNEFTILTYKKFKFMDLPFLRAFGFIVFGFFEGIKKDCDVIHAHYAVPQGLLGTLLKHVKRKPLITTLHGSDVTILAADRRPFTRALVRYVLNTSDVVITVSGFLKSEILKLGIPEDKVKVTYGGVPEDGGPEEPFDVKGKNILFVGSLVRQKGVDVLLKAFKNVKKDMGSSSVSSVDPVNPANPTNLIIVGDGKQRPALERLADDLGLEDVYFLGMKRDLKSIFKKSDVLVLPSREEGFGLILLEAMANGVPVIASNVGGVPEIIEDGKNGLLFETGDFEDLSCKITRVLKLKDDESEKLRDTLMERGRETIKKFNWKAMADEVDEIYERYECR